MPGKGGTGRGMEGTPQEKNGNLLSKTAPAWRNFKKMPNHIFVPWRGGLGSFGRATWCILGHTLALQVNRARTQIDPTIFGGFVKNMHDLL